MRGGKRPGAGRKPGAAWNAKPPAMKALAQAAVRHVLAENRNPVLRLVEIAYDPTVDKALQVTAAAAAAPYLFPKKSLDVTATVALDAPNASAVIDKLLRQFAGRDRAIEIGALPAAETAA